MPGIGSALGDDFDFGARGTVEIGGLACRVYLELLHAVLRRGQHAGGPAALCCSQVSLSGHTPGRIARHAGKVHVLAAVHVAAVVATVQREVTLIEHRAGHAAIGAHARLQLDERADVAAKARQVVQSEACNGVSYGGIHGLQFGAGGSHLHHHIRAAHLQRQVDRQAGPNSHLLVLGLGGCKSSLADSNAVDARVHVHIDVSPGGVGGRGACSIGRSVSQRHRRACQHRAGRIRHGAGDRAG